MGRVFHGLLVRHARGVEHGLGAGEVVALCEGRGEAVQHRLAVAHGALGEVLEREVAIIGCWLGFLCSVVVGGVHGCAVLRGVEVVDRRFVHNSGPRCYE